MSAALSAWTGFGFLFVGIRLIGLHVQPLIGGRIHAFIARSMSHPILPRLAGFISGSLTSSASAVVFVSAGLLSAGAATLAQTLPLLAWANAGTASLVLLATLNIKALALGLVGAIGLSFLMNLDNRSASRHALFALLGVALLVLGLSFIKEGATGLKGDPLAEEFLLFAGSQAAVGYLVGLILSIILQSSSIVSVMTLPLLQSGLISFDAVVPLIYGACLGSGLSVVLLAGPGAGPAQQLAICQAGLRIGASAIVLLMAFLEAALELPLMVHAIERLTPHEPLRAGLLFVGFQCILVVVSQLAARPLERAVVWLSPPPAVALASRPQHLFDEGRNDPQTALTLARLELNRLVIALPDFLDEVRDRTDASDEQLRLSERHAASSLLAGHIEAFLAGAIEINEDASMTNAFFRERARLTALRQLQSTLLDFALGLSSVPPDQRPEVANTMVEGLHTILLTAADALTEADALSAQLLAGLTEERSDLMDTVRAGLMSASGSADHRESLLSATMTFERALWQLRALAREATGDKPAA